MGSGGRTNGGYNNSYEKNGSPSDQSLPPRFKKMTMYGSSNGSSTNGDIQLRPANGNLMLKPKTPAILPKSARLDNGPLQPNNGVTNMNVLEPVYISKKGGDKGRTEKKNHGPTREEVFTRIDEVIAKLVETDSTNEAFTVWKEGSIPNKMVNNALIHMFKKVVKLDEESKRVLAFQLVDQLIAEDIITQVHCKESLARIIQSHGQADEVSQGIVDLSTWCLTSNKTDLAELGEMTDGGSVHPLFLSILQKLASDSEDLAQSMFTESGVKLLDQLPQNMRSEEQLGKLLEEMKLTFLVPMLAIKSELRRLLIEEKISTTQLQDWIVKNVDEAHQENPSFMYGLMEAIICLIMGSSDIDKENEAEKDMIRDFKPVLKTFLKGSIVLQLSCIYALQVFCHEQGFPKGLMLRWFMALYENDVIEEQAFLKWKEDVNDTYPGKGKALFQVNQWLTWLEEAESEEEEDEE
jgi:translation initiation factor 4G